MRLEWGWGYGGCGIIGNCSAVHQSSPVQVGTGTNWKQVCVSEGLATAIKTDGTLWTWGQNSFGQLGQGNTTYLSSPKQVGSLTTWATTFCGGSYVLATKTDGTLWTWGGNYYGQLGLNFLSNQRCNNYNDWINVGMCLFNINTKYFSG